MTRRIVALLAASMLPFVGSALVATTAQAQPTAKAGQPTARAVRAEQAPTLDGMLDDRAWRQAPEYGAFVERKPTLRAEPPVATRFRIVFDDQALYLAVRCDDDAERIAARTRGRDDAAIFSDDAISIKLDPAFDRRTTLGFVTNPIGAKLDYRGIDESDFRIEFDTTWQVAVSRDDQGWSAEFRIPFSSLGIDPAAPPKVIGLNLSRDHGSRNATYDWALIPPPFSPIAASRYGTLEGLEQLAGPSDAGAVRSYSVTPYALGGMRRSQAQGSPDLENEALLNAGLDATAELGPVSGHLTLNTDFAQVDLDNQVVNLTRFGLFLPEKRDFFLNDLEVLSFGIQQEAQMLYSRRIGLDDDGEVPIVGGLKLVGRPHDSVRTGVLQVVTRPAADTPWTSSSVGRTLVELGGGSNVGVMLAHRQSLEAADDRNLMVGLDGAWRGEDVPLVLTSFVMGSLTGPDGGAPQIATGGAGTGRWADHIAPGVGTSLSLRNELVRPTISYAYYHPELRGDLGYFQRVGIHRGDASLTLEPRINAHGLEKLTATTSGSVIADADAEQVLDWRGTCDMTLYWKTGWYLGAAATRRLETIVEPFTVGRETEIAVDSYDMLVASVYGGTPGTYPLSASTYLTAREYYGGTLYEVSADASWRASELFQISAGTLYDRVLFEELPDFDSAVVNTRLAFGFTTRLGITLYNGYNLLRDVVQFQSRLRWIYVPGADLFVVYQVDMDDERWVPTFMSAIVKTQVRWP